MKRMILVLLTVCLMLSMSTTVFAGHKTMWDPDKTGMEYEMPRLTQRQTMAIKVGGDDIEAFKANAQALKEEGEKIREGVEEESYAVYFVPSEADDYLRKLGFPEDNIFRYDEKCDALDFAIRTLNLFTIKAETYYPKKTTTAASLFSESGSSAGPLVITGVGGIAVGMGLMALLQKKKAPKA